MPGDVVESLSLGVFKSKKQTSVGNDTGYSCSCCGAWGMDQRASWKSSQDAVFKMPKWRKKCDGLKSISRYLNRGWMRLGFVILVWTVNDFQIIKQNKWVNMSPVIYKWALSH